MLQSFQAPTQGHWETVSSSHLYLSSFHSDSELDVGALVQFPLLQGIAKNHEIYFGDANCRGSSQRPRECIGGKSKILKIRDNSYGIKLFRINLIIPRSLKYNIAS